MNNMTRIRIGDADHYVDAAVAHELEYLRGMTAALKAMTQGTVLPPAAQPMADAVTTSRLAARDAILAEQAANRDPNTPRGAYAEWLSNAWRTAGAGDRA